MARIRDLLQYKTMSNYLMYHERVYNMQDLWYKAVAAFSRCDSKTGDIKWTWMTTTYSNIKTNRIDIQTAFISLTVYKMIWRVM